MGANMSSDDTLLVFCRSPVEGQCKTRLIPQLGERGALQAHCELALATLARLAAVRGQRYLYLSDESAVGESWAHEYGYHLAYQQGSDLGQRMKHAFEQELANSAGPVCLVGVDCPPIGQSYVEQAFSALGACDLVLGPAQDGGYGLIGMNKCQAELFEDIPWGSARVLAATLAAAKRVDLKVAMLPQIWDVDDFKDWQRYKSL